MADLKEVARLLGADSGTGTGEATAKGTAEPQRKYSSASEYLMSLPDGEDEIAYNYDSFLRQYDIWRQKKARENREAASPPSSDYSKVELTPFARTFLQEEKKNRKGTGVTMNTPSWGMLTFNSSPSSVDDRAEADMREFLATNDFGKYDARQNTEKIAGMEKQLAELKKLNAQRTKEISDEFKKKNLLPPDAVEMQSRTPFGAVANMAFHEDLKPWEAVQQERKALEKAQQIIDAYKDAKSHNALVQALKELGRGWEDTLADIVTVGFSEMESEAKLSNIVDRANKNGYDSLSPDEKRMFTAQALKGAMEEYFSPFRTTAQNVGSIVKESIPFSTAFIPAGAVAKAATKGMQTAAKAAGKSLAGRALNVADYSTRAALMTLVEPSTYAKALENINGDAGFEYNDNTGRIEYTGRENAMSAGEALKQAMTSQFIENMSEFSGGAIELAGGKMGALRRAFGDGSFINRSNDFLRKFGWNGTVNEFLEEQVSTLGHSLVGDGEAQWSDFTSPDRQLETLLGVAVPGVGIAAVSAADSGIRRHNVKRNYEKAVKDFDTAFGGNAGADLKADLASVAQDEDVEHVNAKIKETLRRTDLTPQQKDAAVNLLVRAVGYNQMNIASDERKEAEVKKAQEDIRANTNQYSGSVITGFVVEEGDIPVVIYSRVVRNGDGSINAEQSDPQLIYSVDGGQKKVTSIRNLKGIKQEIPADEAARAAAQAAASAVEADRENGEAPTYDVGREVTATVDGGQTFLRGTIAAIDEKGNYVLQAETPQGTATVAVEPRHVVNEDNIAGVDNGSIVVYVNNRGETVEGEVTDIHSLRNQGLAVIGTETVPVSRIKGPALSEQAKVEAARGVEQQLNPKYANITDEVLASQAGYINTVLTLGNISDEQRTQYGAALEEVQAEMAKRKELKTRAGAGLKPAPAEPATAPSVPTPPADEAARAAAQGQQPAPQPVSQVEEIRAKAPRRKNGEVDYDALLQQDPMSFAILNEAEEGREETLAELKAVRDNLNLSIETERKKLARATSINERKAQKARIRQIEEQKGRVEEAMGAFPADAATAGAQAFEKETSPNNKTAGTTVSYKTGEGDTALSSGNVSLTGSAAQGDNSFAPGQSNGLYRPESTPGATGTSLSNDKVAKKKKPSKKKKKSEFRKRLGAFERDALPIRGKILYDIADGKKFLWNDITSPSGTVTGRGVKNSILATATSANKDMQAYVNILGGKDNAVTPEEYAHALWEETMDRESRLDSLDIMNQVLDALTSVRSRTEALNALERQFGEQPVADYVFSEEDTKMSDREDEVQDLPYEEKGNITEGDRAIMDFFRPYDPNEAVPFQIVHDKALDRVNDRFNGELEGLTAENAGAKVLYLGTPSAKLQSAGIDSKPFKLYGSKLLKKIRKHGFKFTDIKNLPRAIAHPIAVFKGSENDSHAILTEIQIDGNNVLVAVNVGKNRDIDFNIVSSTYGKSGKGVIDWINNGKLLYSDKEKTLNYLGSPALIAGAVNNSELESATKIIEEFENPPIREQNSTDDFKPIGKKALDRLVNVLKKKGLALEVITDLQEFNRRLDELKDGKGLKDNGGRVYGFVTGEGRVYLNPSLMNANTPIHEFGHLWWKAMPQGMKTEITELLKKTPGWKELSNNPAYENLKTDEQKADELFQTLLGNYGENSLKVREILGDDISLRARIQNAVNEFLTWLRAAFGNTDAKLERFAGMTLSELLNGKEAPFSRSHENGAERRQRKKQAAASRFEDFLNNTDKGKKLVAQAVGETAKAKQQADRVSAFIKDVLDGKIKNGKQKIELPKAANRQAEKALGRKIESRSIHADEIRHINKNHGEKGLKNNDNSIPLRKEDVALLPYIMGAPDRVTKASADVHGRESVRYYKDLSNGYVVVVEREGRFSDNDMEAITMWAETKSHSPYAANARNNRPSPERLNPKGFEQPQRQPLTIGPNDAARIQKDFETALEREQNLRLQEYSDSRFQIAITPDGKAKVTYISPIGFYSTVEYALNRINQEKGSPEQFKAMLLKNGAKQAELDWMGWNEIAENKKSITKAEIYDWIERNRIDIKEVDSKFTDVDEYEESIDDFLDKLYSIYSIIPSQASKLGKPFDARVEDITIDDFTVKSIPVTEKMKHSVMEKGVPFFHSQIQYADASKYDFDVSGITEENAQEMQAIKDKSVENGTFMKAPNGKQSNLNERQWLQVRTGAFKKWFGDWEGAAQAIKGIEILRSFFNGKTGLLGNVNNPQIGSINIYSGEAGTETKQYKNGNGLEHIIARRWIEGNNVAETLFGINDALARGKILRDYGGENGRIDLQYGDYIAVISKQRFGNAEQWTLTGFKIKSDVERESYNPDDYALYSSVSRNKVGADFNAKVQQKIDSANSYSRVVDANGEPLVVYHGTSNEFTVFGEKKGNSQGTYLKNRNGFFFANRKEAELYGNGILMPAFINLRNPNMVDVQHNLSELEYDYKTEREEAEAAGYPIARWLGEGEAAFEANDSATAYLDDNMDEIIEETENNNNDGVFVIGADGSRTVISLAPSQIKSAAANNGNFDNNSDDIRFQRKYKNVGAGSVRAGLKPALAEIQNEISRAEQETDTNPTEGQKKAGNYRKGHVRIQGFDISIEQPKGSVRRGVDENGKAWESKMYNTYGYFGKTESRDGDHIDVFLGENPLSKKVFVVDQVNPETGNFDEHKVMFGFDSIDAARKAYLSNYEKGWKGLGSITETDVETFRSWANKDGARVKAFSQYRDIPSGVEEKKTRIEKLRNSKPVEITGKEITPSEDLKEYRKNANDYGLTLRDSYTNKDTGKNISLGKSGVKEVTSHDLSKEQLQSVAAIPQIIENAIYIDTINNEDSDKNSDVASYDYFVAGLKIDGVDYTVKAVVANGVNGERYYDHKLTQIEKTKLIDLLNQSAYSSALSGLSSKTASGVLSNEDSGNQSQGNKTSTPVSAIKDKRLLSILKTEPSQSTEKPDDGVRFQIRSAGKASDAGADSKSDITDRARASLNRKLSGTTRLREIYQDRFIAVKHFIDTLKKFGTEVADHDNWYLSATHQDGKVDAQLDAYNRKFQRPLNEIISRRFDIHCEGLSFSSGKHQVHCSLLQCRWRKSMPSI